MDYNTVIIAITIGLISYYFCKARSKCRKTLPPGPLGIPLLGFLPFLRTDIFRQFQEMTKKYGPIFTVNIGTKTILILNDWTSINEAFNNKRDVFSGRPEMFVFNEAFGFKCIVTESSTADWKAKKKVTQSTLRRIGKSMFNVAVQQEAIKFTAHFEQFIGTNYLMQRAFCIPSVNMMMNLLFGEQYEYSSDWIKRFADFLRVNSDISNAVSYVNIFPCLRFLSSTFCKFREYTLKLKSLLLQKIDEHKSKFVQGNETSDYVEAYLNHTSKSDVDQERLLNDINAFLQAGTETTASTLSFGIMFMAVWPDIQTKLQEEIDNSVGKSTVIQYTDRLKLPYTQAVLLEVQRYVTVVPLAVPHMTMSATKLCGYDIPANMEVWPNLWAVHHDPELWGDPDVFRPERFLDSEGKVAKPEYLIPFSTGTRRCLGEDLAKMEMFMIFAATMQKFMFRCPVGHPPPSLKPFEGVTLSPQPYSVIFQKRF